MSNTPGGKGSAPRPHSVDPKTFVENFNRIFGTKSKKGDQGLAPPVVNGRTLKGNVELVLKEKQSVDFS